MLCERAQAAAYVYDAGRGRCAQKVHECLRGLYDTKKIGGEYFLHHCDIHHARRLRQDACYAGIVDEGIQVVRLRGYGLFCLLHGTGAAGVDFNKRDVMKSCCTELRRGGFSFYEVTTAHEYMIAGGSQPAGGFKANAFIGAGNKNCFCCFVHTAKLGSQGAQGKG